MLASKRRIDGEVALSPEARANMAVRVHDSRSSWEPLPVGVCTFEGQRIRVRSVSRGDGSLSSRAGPQRVGARVGARFEARSYGFVGRGCADAIQSYSSRSKGHEPTVWILDADLSAAFDRIDHPRLLDKLGSFPAGKWSEVAQAGVIENGGFAPTERVLPKAV